MNTLMKKYGHFLCIEGPDGSGKTTQLELLRQYLEWRGVEVVVVREPGGTVIGEGIRNLFKENFGHTHSLTEVFMMLAAKTQLNKEIIEPALARGAWVITDRYTPSLYAYQGGGHKVSQRVLDALVGQGYKSQAFRTPDATLVLQISREEQARRLALRSNEELDKIDTANADFRERVYSVYQKIAERQLNAPLGTITRPVDADQSVQEVHAEIKGSFWVTLSRLDD